MKARTTKALCWEHGYRSHLVDGTEDRIWNFGLCSRCLLDFIPNPVERREFVRRHFALEKEPAA